MVALGVPGADLYDWAEAEEDEGEALVGGGRMGYREVADTLRARILSDDPKPGYRPRDTIPGHSILAKELDADVAVVNKAVNDLARAGLVDVPGRGMRTVVLEQRRWRASVTVRWRGGIAVPEGARSAAKSAIETEARSDAAVTELAAEYVLLPSTHDAAGGPALVTQMTVLASNVALAVGHAWAVVGSALRGQQDWDLDRPSAGAVPVEA